MIRASRLKSEASTGVQVWQSRHVRTTYVPEWYLWHTTPAMHKPAGLISAVRARFWANLVSIGYARGEPIHLFHEQHAYSTLGMYPRPHSLAGSNTVVTAEFIAGALGARQYRTVDEINEAYLGAVAAHSRALVADPGRDAALPVMSAGHLAVVATYRGLFDRYLGTLGAIKRANDVPIIVAVLLPATVPHAACRVAFSTHASALRLFDYALCRLVERVGLSTGRLVSVDQPGAGRVKIGYRSDVQTVGVAQKGTAEATRVALMCIGRMLLGYFSAHPNYARTLVRLERLPIELLLLAEGYNNVVDDEHSHHEFMYALQTTLDNDEYAEGYPTTSADVVAANDKRERATPESRQAAADRRRAQAYLGDVATQVKARFKTATEAVEAHQTARTAGAKARAAQRQAAVEAEYANQVALMGVDNQQITPDTTANPDYSAWADSLPG